METSLSVWAPSRRLQQTEVATAWPDSRAQETDASPILTVRTVSTADKLQQAVLDDDQDIQIVEHLDLRTGQLYGSPLVPQPYVLEIDTPTQSITGACEDGPSASMLAKLRYATPPDVMPGQCLLITEGGIMRLKDAAMMLANLFIAIVPADENRHLENPALDILDSTGWAENVTVDGQNIKTCKDSCGIRVRTATVTIVASTLKDFGAAGPDLDIQPGSSVFLQQTKLWGAVEASGGLPVSASTADHSLIYLGAELCGVELSYDSLLRMSDCEYSGTVGIVATDGYNSSVEVIADEPDNFAICSLLPQDMCLDPSNEVCNDIIPRTTLQPGEETLFLDDTDEWFAAKRLALESPERIPFGEPLIPPQPEQESVAPATAPTLQPPIAAPLSSLADTDEHADQHSSSSEEQTLTQRVLLIVCFSLVGFLLTLLAGMCLFKDGRWKQVVQKVEIPQLRSGQSVRVQQRLVAPISNDSVQVGGLQYMADEVPDVFGALQQVLNRGAVMKVATGKKFEILEAPTMAVNDDLITRSMEMRCECVILDAFRELCSARFFLNATIMRMALAKLTPDNQVVRALMPDIVWSDTNAHGDIKIDDEPVLPFIVMRDDRTTSIKACGHRNTTLIAIEMLFAIGTILETLHAEGFVHREVTGENVRLVKGADGKVKWQLCGWLLLCKAGEHCAIPVLDPSMPPELVRMYWGKSAVAASCKEDVFRFCVLGIECITRKPILCFSDPPMTAEQALQAVLQPDRLPYAVTEDHNVIQGMGALGRILLKGLNPDPVLRPTMRSLMRDVRQAYDEPHARDEPLAQIRSVMAEMHYDIMPIALQPAAGPSNVNEELAGHSFLEIDSTGVAVPPVSMQEEGSSSIPEHSHFQFQPSSMGVSQPIRPITTLPPGSEVGSNWVAKFQVRNIFGEFEEAELYMPCPTEMRTIARDGKLHMNPNRIRAVAGEKVYSLAAHNLTPQSEGGPSRARPRPSTYHYDAYPPPKPEPYGGSAPSTLLTEAPAPELRAAAAAAGPSSSVAPNYASDSQLSPAHGSSAHYGSSQALSSTANLPTPAYPSNMRVMDSEGAIHAPYPAPRSSVFSKCKRLLSVRELDWFRTNSTNTTESHAASDFAEPAEADQLPLTKQAKSGSGRQQRSSTQTRSDRRRHS